MGMSGVEAIADFQRGTRPDTFGAQSRTSKVRRHAEEKDVSVRAGRENAAQLNARAIDARDREIRQRTHAGRELDRIGCIGELGPQRAQTEGRQARKTALTDIRDDDFTRADYEYPHARARARFDARRRPGDIKGRERNRLRNIPRDFGPPRAREEKGSAARPDRIRLRIDGSELHEAERSQRQTGERRDARTNRRRIGIGGSDGTDLPDQYAARVCHPIVELASLLDDGQQGSSYRMQVASV